MCGTLSSADIVHLAVTSKENWAYITDSNAIYRQLHASAVCDGRGIVAREKLFFGRQLADEGKLDQDDCLGPDAKPCSDCGAMVCDVSAATIFWSDTSADIDPELSFPLRVPL